MIKIYLIYHWTKRQIVQGFLKLACNLSINHLLVISKCVLGDDRNGQKGLLGICPTTHISLQLVSRLVFYAQSVFYTQSTISLQRHVTPEYGCRGLLLLNVPAHTQC